MTSPTIPSTSRETGKYNASWSFRKVRYQLTTPYTRNRPAFAAVGGHNRAFENQKLCTILVRI